MNISQEDKLTFQSENTPEENYSILKEDVFSWFIEVNISLINSRQFRLPKNQFDLMFKSHWKEIQIASCPREVITFGHRYGLIGYDYNDSHHFFPLARLISTNKANNDTGIFVLRETTVKDFLQDNLDDVINILVYYGLSLHGKDLSGVLSGKESIHDQSHPKPEKIGCLADLNRQEFKSFKPVFFHQIYKNPNKYLWPFLKALIFIVISRSGSLIQYLNGKNEKLFKFLCKCCQISYMELSNIDLALLFDNSPKLKSFFNNKNAFRIDFSEVCKDTKALLGNDFSFEDIVDVAKKAQKFRYLKIKSSKKFIQTQVESIIDRFYFKSKKPVSFSTIIAELGKFHENVDIRFAKQCIYADSKIKKIEKEKYILLTDKELKELKAKSTKIDVAFLEFDKQQNDVEQKINKEFTYKAIWKCEHCSQLEAYLFYKNRFVYLKCTSCGYERKYPAGVWGVSTNIPCPKCKNDFVIGFHPKYGPYLKCKKCEFWDKLIKYLKSENNN